MSAINYSKPYRRLFHKNQYKKNGRLIGLLGGSFNPAHAGHRAMSILAMKEYKLDEIWWLVVESNPLKPVKKIPPLQQRAAAAKAIACHPRVKIKTLAGKKNYYSYDAVKNIMQHHPRDNFVFIMGSDCWFEFHRWYRWRALMRLLPIVVLGRAPTHLLYRRARASMATGGIGQDRGIKIHRFAHPLNGISSTALRED